MSYFHGSKGAVYHYAWLPPDPPSSVVVLLHGYGEHLGLYDELARRLVVDGHAVHAMDVLGHGRSAGERAVIETWDHLVHDARQLVGIATEQHPGAPLVLLGHSGGALAAMLLALREPTLAQALVLSGAVLLPQAWIEEELASGRPESDAGDPTEWLSTHPEYVHALLHDPLTWKGGFRRKTLAAVAATWPEVRAGLTEGRPSVPVLFVHGDQDPVVPADHARQLADVLPRATVRTFLGDLHDVLNEHDRESVHEAVVGFLAETLSSNRPARSGHHPVSDASGR